MFVRVAEAASLMVLVLFNGRVYGGHLIGATFSGSEGTVLYDLDPTTGLATNPRPTGMDRVAGLAILSDDTLLGLTTASSPSAHNMLFGTDAETGASMPVGATGLQGIIEGDLAYDPTTGGLYGLYVLQQGARKLFTINPSTGQAALLPGALAGDPSGMAFDAAGTLHVLDVSLQTVTAVDKVTGSAISSQSLSTSLGTTAAMAFDPVSQKMYVVDGESGGHDSLFTLNVATGALSLVGSTGIAGGFSGLVWIPEPGTLLMTIAALGMIIRRR